MVLQTKTCIYHNYNGKSGEFNWYLQILTNHDGLGSVVAYTVDIYQAADFSEKIKDTDYLRVNEDDLIFLEFLTKVQHSLATFELPEITGNGITQGKILKQLI